MLLLLYCVCFKGGKRERKGREQGEKKEKNRNEAKPKAEKKKTPSLSSYRLLDEHVARLPLPLRVVGRPGVPRGGAAVRVRDAAAVVRDLDAAEDELVVALLEAVEVEAVADAEGEDRGGGGGRGGVDGCCCGGRGEDGAARRKGKCF